MASTHSILARGNTKSAVHGPDYLPPLSQANEHKYISFIGNPDDASFWQADDQAASLASVQTSTAVAPTVEVTQASLTTITAAGSSVTLDETTGLQNSNAAVSIQGDDDDNDTSLTLPTPFSGRLTTLLAATTPTETLIGTALSGYDGVNTGQNAFTITSNGGGTVTDVRFTDSVGALLNGLDSGLDTASGVSIYLYTDTTNNNILLGRAAAENGTADPTGAIVFASYIDETGSPAVTGGKIWTVLYQPLHHNDPTKPDDFVDLSNKVFIGTTQDTEFSLANAPSGQNLFLMFTTANPATEMVDGVNRITGVSIIATGKDPANQSTGVNITTGDTINTSQAGGPTTFGTNNQMITEQEGIRFTFVTGATQNVTIPNLDQNEADLENNVDFTGVFGARTATFDVVQLQSGKSAQVKISAFNTASEPGTGFIDGYANDTAVAITNVRVINIATGLVLENASSDGTLSVNDPSIFVTFAAGVATITGVKAGYKIEYTTTADHNRVLVENAAALSAKGNDHADFDIGGFKLSQLTTATEEIGSKLIFEDDGPSIRTTGTEPILTVDETVLANDATASFAANFSSAFGADGAGTLTYALGVVAGASGLTDTDTGEAVNLSLTAGGVVEGRTATTNLLVFTVSVAANGDVTLDQMRAVVHTDATNPDDSTSLTADNLVTLTATKTDKDGDSAQATLDIGQNLVFKDDGPSITVSVVAAADALAVDETDLSTNAQADFSDNFSNTPVYGADGAGTAISSAYALDVKSSGVDSGLDDVASGNSVFLYLEGGQVVGRVGTSATTADPAGAISFTVSVSPTGTVTLDQLLAMKHPDGTNPDDAVSPSAADLISLTRTDTITDKDGDTNTGFATIDIADALSFEDDGPAVSTNLSVKLDDDALAGGNAGGANDDVDSENTSGTLAHSYGADGGSIAYLSTGAPAGFSYVADGDNLLVKQSGTTVMTLTLNTSTGAYTVTQNNPIMHATGNDENNQAFTINYRVTDGDGDTADGTLGISVDDDTPLIQTSPVKDTAPTLGATQWTYSEAFAYSIGADAHGPSYGATDSDFTELSLTGLANDVAIGSSTVTWSAETDASATFGVSFTYDHDRDPATAMQSVAGQLVFDKNADTYTLAIDALQTKVDVTLGQGTGYETYDIGGTTPSSGPSPVATGKLGEGFYLQITGFESPLSADGNTVLTDGELVSGKVAPVTLSSTALGVSGNTIQAGEAAKLDFFTSDPKGNLSATDFATATDFYIKFDGIETESDDLILVLNLVDASDPAVTTTRAIYVDQGDIYERDTINTGLAGTKYEALTTALDNNDGLLIVESNDYNFGGNDNWVLTGLQILSNDAGLTGSAINLNRDVGSSGGSSYLAETVSGLIGPGNTVQEDNSTNPLKIIDAGFSTTTTTPPVLDLTLVFKVVDADGDYTSQQTIDIEYGLPAQQVALVGISAVDFETAGLT